MSSSEPSQCDTLSKPGRGRPGRLVLVATPIGNLGDLSPAIEALKGADAIACEDSRVTGGLLYRFGIDRPMLPYHDHNADRMRPRLIAKLLDGETVALVSDAGTPLVSDPGHKLVRAAIEAGISVTGMPGPSAPILALILSGLPGDRFLFAGFLPAKGAQRRGALAELAAIPATLLLFETAPRLAESLADCALVLGDRPAAVARELTKMHEEVRRGALSELAAHYAEAGPPKGEIVLVIGPPPAEGVAPPDLETALRAALAEGHSPSRAAALVAAETGQPKRKVYALALELTKP